MAKKGSRPSSPKPTHRSPKLASKNHKHGAVTHAKMNKGRISGSGSV
jgi:hypothetical protein